MRTLLSTCPLRRNLACAERTADSRLLAEVRRVHGIGLDNEITFAAFLTTFDVQKSVRSDTSRDIPPLFVNDAYVVARRDGLRLRRFALDDDTAIIPHNAPHILVP